MSEALAATTLETLLLLDAKGHIINNDDTRFFSSAPCVPYIPTYQLQLSVKMWTSSHNGTTLNDYEWVCNNK